MIFVIILLISLIILFFIIRSLLSYNSISTDKTIVNPMKDAFKVDCVHTRTPCDPNDLNSCSRSCNNPEEMQCINLDLFQPIIKDSTGKTKDVNGGGYVCLPKQPDNEHCDFSNGGALVWTGYGFTDSEDWGCLCTIPEIYTGPQCKNINPEFCSGGSVSINSNNYNLIDSCTCPPNTKKLIRNFSKSPLCVSTDPNQGQGLSGLAGNEESTWASILFNPNINDNKITWSNEISNYLKIPQPTVSTILVNSTNALSQANADDLCSKVTQNTSTCNNGKAINFNPEVIYTYYDNTSLP